MGVLAEGRCRRLRPRLSAARTPGLVGGAIASGGFVGLASPLAALGSLGLLDAYSC